MISLEERIRAALGSEVRLSAWEQLSSLFRADREAFFLLLCDADRGESALNLGELSDLAARVGAAIRESYGIEGADGGANVVSFSGQTTFIPDELVERVGQFLREVDGKSTASGAGRDYEGEEVLEAEVRFKLGDRATWAADRAKIEQERNAKPVVPPVNPKAGGTAPAYPAPREPYARREPNDFR
jgi:hypothetical protein